MANVFFYEGNGKHGSVPCSMSPVDTVFCVTSVCNGQLVGQSCDVCLVSNKKDVSAKDEQIRYEEDCKHLRRI